MLINDDLVPTQFLDATIVIPTRGYEPLTEKCLSYCLDFFPGAELIVLSDEPFNLDRSGSKVIVQVTGKVSIAKKRNLGCRLSSRGFLAFIDSDAFPERSWLRNALCHFKTQPERVAAICGPNVSPEIQSKSERLVGLVAKSNLIVINAHLLKNPAPARLVNSAPSCNLIVKKSIYESLNGMDEKLTGGEDFEFCNRLIKKEWKIFYTPDVLVYHKNRDLKNFFLQRLSYGGFSADRIGKDFSFQFWISLTPFLFVAFLMFGFLLLSLGLLQAPILGVIAVYLVVTLIESIRISESILDIPLVFFIMCVALITPGIGAFLKILKLLPGYDNIYRNDR